MTAATGAASDAPFLSPEAETKDTTPALDTDATPNLLVAAGPSLIDGDATQTIAAKSLPPLATESVASSDATSTPLATEPAKELAKSAGSSTQSAAPKIAAALATAAIASSVMKLAAEKRAASPLSQQKIGDRLRSFADHHGLKAAGVMLLLGCGWVVGANSFDSSQAQQRTFAAIRALDSKIEAIASEASAKSDVAPLRTSVAQLKTSVDATRNNVAAAVAQLTTKTDRIDRETTARQEKLEKDYTARLDRLTERLARVERGADAGVTGTIPLPVAPAPVTLPPRSEPRANDIHAPQPQSETRAQPDARTKPDSRVSSDRARVPGNGYVLRNVRDGVALVESRAGLREVLPGDNLPGAGRVRSIERRGRQWVVITTNGLIDADSY